jgi:hypothetical protein
LPIGETIDPPRGTADQRCRGHRRGHRHRDPVSVSAPRRKL